MKKVNFTLACVCVVLSSLDVHGARSEAVVRADGGLTWQTSADGVEVEWNADGRVRRLSSKYSIPVEFPDRRGVSKAQTIAEEKAKANIVRFMNQSTSSTRIVTELQADINKAVQKRETGTPAQVRKIDERTVVESLAEITTSFATGTLRGVVVLERGFDDKAQEAWVVVGISERTIRAAAGTKGLVDETGKAGVGSPETERLEVQPGEIRRPKQRDW